ncbi:MAG: tyrosine-type recombinase/integrase [Phycisphaerales bacterium]
MLATIPRRYPGTHPVQGGSSRRKPRRRLPPEVLTDAEVRALMNACGGSATGLRNRALIALLYRAGLRIREALELRPKDLDLAAGAVRVLWGKGGSSRVSGLDGGAAAVVARWLDVRACHGATGLAPVFCTLRGGRLTEAYVRVLLPRLARRAGIEKRVHAHGLRHTHAAQLRTEGLDIGLISKQLGHRSIATTARYLDHIAPVAVVEAIAGRRWG